MVVITLCNIYRGQTTFDTLKIFNSSGYKKFICVPDQRLSPSSIGAVFSVDSAERIYDLGPRENWRAIWYQHWWVTVQISVALLIITSVPALRNICGPR
jgi:hypothetical protein